MVNGSEESDPAIVAKKPCQGLRPRRADRRSRWRARTCCLPLSEQRRHPEFYSFRGSMAGLCTPLSTLHPNPRRLRRTTRGRCGSLLLHRDGLSPSSPCRSPGALRLSYNFYR